MKKQILWVFRESDTNAKRWLSQLKYIYFKVDTTMVIFAVAV
jgi:hypothetical protein